MNPTTTLTNNNPPATHRCGLNPSPICREESDTPQQSGMIAEVFLPGPKSDMELAAGPETGRGPVGVHHELMRAG